MDLNRNFSDPSQDPYNFFVHYVGNNPITTFNLQYNTPKVHPRVFIGPFSSVIGDVTIEQNCFIAPLVSIRADEGTPFYIEEECNFQDGAILHGLREGKVRVNGRSYSIYLEAGTAVTHGAIVHGPAFVGRNSFVGFQSLVFQAIVGRDVYIANNAVVTGKVVVKDGRFVPPGTVIDTQEKADSLGPVPKSAEEFAQAVKQINKDFSSGYNLMFGRTRCTCGVTCNL